MAYVEGRNSRWRVRYLDENGSWASRSGFDSKTEADAWAKSVEVDQRRDVFVDPRMGETTFEEWVHAWRSAMHVGPATEAKYDVFLRRHILPRFGRQPIKYINRLAVRGWIKDMHGTHQPSTVASVRSLFSSILEEAVEERIIPLNPCRRLRTTPEQTGERPTLDEHEVAHVATAARDYELMVLCAAYLGLRWGELAGLHLSNLDLGKGRLYVHPDNGALHEVGGKLWLGPPKSAAAVRWVSIPPFLADLLRAHLDRVQRDHLFLGENGAYLRRSNFNRRHWRPALVRAGLLGRLTRDGNAWTAHWQDKAGIARQQATNTEAKAVALVTRNEKRPGIHLHDLRHTHKTWLIEDGVPEVAQARRLGHKMRGVQGIYSHVTPEVERRLVEGLQARWERTQG